MHFAKKSFSSCSQKSRTTVLVKLAPGDNIDPHNTRHSFNCFDYSKSTKHSCYRDDNFEISSRSDWQKKLFLKFRDSQQGKYIFLQKGTEISLYCSL